MFRITRGHHVQHIHFPLPVIRDLDGAEEERDDSHPPASPVAEQEGADASAGTPEAAR